MKNPDLKKIYHDSITADWITEPVTDTQYAIEETAETITIKFQYTVSFKDWVFNFLFFPIFWKPYKGMKNIFFVHYGFLKKYKSVRKIILDYLKGADKKIIVEGYSEGADIAEICTEDLIFHGCDVKGYGFGTSRVFSIFGKKILDEQLKNFTRVENGNDIVTKLPPWWLLFRHYGNKIHIGKKHQCWRFSIKDHMSYGENL